MTTFHERQQFRQPWLWLVLGASTAPPLVILGAGLYQQLVLGRPFGNRPMSDAGMIATSAGLFLLIAGVLALMWLARLDVAVTDSEIVINFFPFHMRPRRIARSDIAEARARKYSPIGEYGGWGIRWGLQGMAYNVSGNEGVQLVLENGKRILIGSQRPEELAAELQSHRASELQSF